MRNAVAISTMRQTADEKIMKRFFLPAVLLLSSCGKTDVAPARAAVREVPPTPIAAATPAVRDPAAESIMNHRQVLFRLQLRRTGLPPVTQKQIDSCLGAGYSLVIDRIARPRRQEPEIHTLYLKIPKTVAAAEVAKKLETLSGVEQVRWR